MALRNKPGSFAKYAQGPDLKNTGARSNDRLRRALSQAIAPEER